MANYRPLTREEYYHELDSDPFFYQKMRGGQSFYKPFRNKITGEVEWFHANRYCHSHCFYDDWPKDEYGMIYG